jgi:hypothetical protein
LIRKFSTTICAILVLSFLLNGFGFATWDGWRQVGYILYAAELFPGPGLKADIYTISPSMSGFDCMYQCVHVQLSYYNSYWLQMGYIQSSETFPLYSKHYYYQKSDSLGIENPVTQSPWGPYTATWHTYFIVHPFEYGEYDDPHWWQFFIEGGACFQQRWVLPYYAVDQWAWLYASGSNIEIDGTHFKRISYMVETNYWHWEPWSDHIPTNYPFDNGYTLDEVSDSEFTVLGGG